MLACFFQSIFVDPHFIEIFQQIELRCWQASTHRILKQWPTNKVRDLKHGLMTFGQPRERQRCLLLL